MYRINKHKPQNRLNILLKQGQKLFHTNDLALLWNIFNKNTLYTAIARYIKKGILIKLHKGFYSIVPIKDLDPVQLGISYLHAYAYLSTETVLAKHGIISQAVDYITLISNTSRKFKIQNYCYIARRLKNKCLYNDVGIFEKNKLKQASPERAVADMLYYNADYYFDGAKLIDWKRVKKIQRIIGYKNTK